MDPREWLALEEPSAAAPPKPNPAPAAQPPADEGASLQQITVIGNSPRIVQTSQGPVEIRVHGLMPYLITKDFLSRLGSKIDTLLDAASKAEGVEARIQSLINGAYVEAEDELVQFIRLVLAPKFSGHDAAQKYLDFMKDDENVQTSRAAILSGYTAPDLIAMVQVWILINHVGTLLTFLRESAGMARRLTTKTTSRENAGTTGSAS